MAAVMVTLLVKVQVGMPKAAMEGVPPRTVKAVVTAPIRSGGAAELGPVGVPSAAMPPAGPGVARRWG